MVPYREGLGHMRSPKSTWQSPGVNPLQRNKTWGGGLEIQEEDRAYPKAKESDSASRTG